MNYNSEQTERGRCLTTFLHMSVNESHYFNTLNTKIYWFRKLKYNIYYVYYYNFAQYRVIAFIASIKFLVIQRFTSHINYFEPLNSCFLKVKKAKNNFII